MLNFHGVSAEKCLDSMIENEIQIHLSAMQQASPGGVTVSHSVLYHDNNSTASIATSPGDSMITSSSQVIMDSNEHNRIKDSQILEAYKNSVYKHPLFPLLALLFEKCEIATQSAEVPSSEGFNHDIHDFVRHQEQDSKPFFSEDSEVDALMIKAIQVLRIHLLELEKVQDLCKDFCNRYITCLKGKMQSENLLRSDYPPYNTSSGGSDSDSQPSTPNSSSHITNGSLPSNNVMVQPSQNSVSLVQNPAVPAATIYQMVHTAQGIIAQPLIQTNTSSNSQPSNDINQSTQTQGHLIHGSTPLSQIGAAPVPSPNEKSMLLSSVPHDEDDDEYYSKKKQKRGVLPKHATTVMRSWLFQHIVHPYPTEDEKRQLASQTHLTLLQVNNWFINARRRIIQPMLDASNPENSGHKTKKPKTHNSRTVQRFWPENIASIQPQLDSASSSPLQNGDKNEEEEEEDSELEDEDMCELPEGDDSNAPQSNHS
ncbi:Homeobox protein PKNOX2 [Nymphon striatum]|nr:Homeobox protein PKNOX2 [Nymphon striatum]